MKESNLVKLINNFPLYEDECSKIGYKPGELTKLESIRSFEAVKLANNWACNTVNMQPKSKITCHGCGEEGYIRPCRPKNPLAFMHFFVSEGSLLF